MGALDPNTTMRNRERLVDRSDAPEYYTDSITQTSVRMTTHPMQPTFTPTTENVYLLQWSTVYKGVKYGAQLVADYGQRDLAYAVLLDHALGFLDSVDLRRSAWGLSSPTFVG